MELDELDAYPASPVEFVALHNGGAQPPPLEPSIRDVLLKFDPFSQVGRPFRFTATHRAILRRARFLLDPAENMAPALDPIRPFGTPNPLGDIGDTAEERTWDGVARLYCEAQVALLLLVQEGRISPGRYRISNLSMRELAWVTDDPKKPLDTCLRAIGIGSSRTFKFTRSHRALLKAAAWRWSGWSVYIQERIKIWPVVLVDAKRTYTARSVQRSFGWKRVVDERGNQILTDQQRRFLWKVHKQVHPAFQVFVEHAELAPGSYVLADLD